MTAFTTIQSSPTKANGLFAQIAETTPGSVKTRDRLFADLKEELELIARLEEEHLLPVLKKHAETKGSVASVREALKRTRELLAEIDAMPREGDEFAARIAELKKAFQEHRRDEKNELLPALKKALSEEEARAVAEKIEADRAEVEAAAAREAEQRREEARREREKEEARQAKIEAAEKEERRQAAEARRMEREREEARQARIEAAEKEERRLAAEARRAEREAAAQAERVAEAERETAKASIEAVRQTAVVGVDVARGALEAGLKAATETAQRSTERVADVWKTAGEASRDVVAVARCGTVVAEGVQGASREWTTWAQTRLRNQAKGFGALLQCRTPQDLFALQTRLFREEVELLLGTGGRVAEIAADTAGEAARTVTTRG